MKLLKSLLFLSILSFALISCDKKEEEAESCKAGTDLSRPEDNIVCSELPILCTEGDNKYWKDSDENTYANTEDGIKDLTKAICTGVEASNFNILYADIQLQTRKLLIDAYMSAECQ